MTEDEKKEIVYLALQDIYHEFNKSVNHLLILREFLRDLLNIKDDKELIYEYLSILNNNKNNSNK